MVAEERLVRPYQGLDRLGRVFDESFLAFGPKRRCEVGDIAKLSPDEFLNLPVQLWFADDLSAFRIRAKELSSGADEASIDLADMEVAVLLSTPRLKLTEVVYRQSATAWADGPHHLDLVKNRRPDSLQTPYGGCRIDAYLFLSRHLEEHPLRPWRKGTWLARASFEVKTGLNDVRFEPLPLGEQERRELGLPEGVLRYCHVDDPLASDLDSAIRLYVDESVLSQLSADPTAPVALAVQRQLCVDAISAVIHAASHDERVHGIAWSGVHDTVIGRLLLRGSSADPGSPDPEIQATRLLRMLSSDPQLVCSMMEVAVPDLVNGIVEALRVD